MKREIPPDSAPSFGRGPAEYPRHAGRWSHPFLPVPVVQCGGAGEKKRWYPPLLHRFPEVEHPDQERCIPTALDARDHGVHGGHPIVLEYGLKIRILAG